MKFKYLFCVQFLVTVSVASTKYTEINTCGSAKVISGNTCSNVQVEFDLETCKTNLTQQLAKKIVCEKNRIKARFDDGDTRYEAEFDKVDDGWNSVSWKIVGPVKQLQKTASLKKSHSTHAAISQPSQPSQPSKPSKPSKPSQSSPPQASVAHASVSHSDGSESITKKQATRDIASINSPAEVVPSPGAATITTNTITSTTGTTPASAFKFGGYSDMRYTHFDAHNDPNITSGNPESGFGIEEGAVYINYEKDKFSFNADLSFRRQKDFDLNTSATKPNQSSSNNLAFGTDRAQLFLKYKVADVFAITFGQFDTIYGVEYNDSKDRVFNKTGLVYDYTLPVTHTGVLLEYSQSGGYVKLMGANPNNKGSNGSSSTGDDRTEYGATAGYTNDNYRIQLGYLTRSITKANGTDNGSRDLLDFIAGITFGRFSADVEYSQVQDASKNTLTSSDSADSESAGMGYLGLLSYKFSDDFLAGVRYEQLKDDPANASIDRVSSSGLSLHYKLTSELELRTEYVDYKIKNLNGDSWTNSRFNVSALVVF